MKKQPIDDYTYQDVRQKVYVNNKIDMNNFADYMSSNIYIGNKDWGSNNVCMCTSKKLKEFASVLDISLQDLISDDIQHYIPAITNGDKNIVVILAGGKSTRNMQNIPNQFINVYGKPIIVYSMEPYQKHPMISDIYVVCLKGWEDILQSYCKQYGITKLKGIIPAGDFGITSIKNSIDFLSNYTDIEYIIFQESTRPLVTEEMISNVIQNAKKNGYAITCEHMVDHLQFFNNSKPKYINRNYIIDAQSPEAYKFDWLKNIFIKCDKEKYDFHETCCAAFIYNLGHPLYFSDGVHNNIKIIRQEDLYIFSALFKNRETY